MATAVEGIEFKLQPLERCRTCETALPLPPAPRVCLKCGSVKITPRHEEWPKALKTFLLLQYAARNLFTANLRPHQSTWELLLTTQYERRFVAGRLRKQGVNPDEMYAIAMKEAEEWRLAGARAGFL